MAQAPARCLNHTERTAVARCKQCHKPLCEKCVQKMPGGVYCSNECYQNMAAFQNRVKELDRRTKRGLNFGSLVKSFAVAVVIGGLIYYVFLYKGVRDFDGLIQLIKGFVP